MLAWVIMNFPSWIRSGVNFSSQFYCFTSHHKWKWQTSDRDSKSVNWDTSNKSHCFVSVHDMPISITMQKMVIIFS